jgi:hypothetical protein
MHYTSLKRNVLLLQYTGFRLQFHTYAQEGISIEQLGIIISLYKTGLSLFRLISFLLSVIIVLITTIFYIRQYIHPSLYSCIWLASSQSDVLTFISALRFNLRLVYLTTPPPLQLGHLTTPPPLQLGHLTTAPSLQLGHLTTALPLQLGHLTTAPPLQLGRLITAPPLHLRYLTTAPPPQYSVCILFPHVSNHKKIPVEVT